MSMNPIVNILEKDILDILVNDHFVGTLSFIQAESGDFYVFEFDWSEWDKYNPGYDVPGVGMDTRADKYVRDFVPEFLSDYLPPVGREDIPNIKRKYGIEGDYTLWKMAKASGRVTADDFRVRPHVSDGFNSAVSKMIG